MLVIELAPQLQTVLEGLGGETLSQKIARLLSNELRRYLEECEREMLELEIKYGMDYQRFKEELESGELGDEFSYPLEKDAMRWEDLTVEKKHWLERVRIINEVVELFRYGDLEHQSTAVRANSDRSGGHGCA